jgi:hypothetical protein
MLPLLFPPPLEGFLGPFVGRALQRVSASFPLFHVLMDFAFVTFSKKDNTASHLCGGGQMVKMYKGNKY